MTFKKQKKKLRTLNEKKFELIVNGTYIGMYTDIDQISRDYNEYKVKSTQFQNGICKIYLTQWG